MTADVIGRTPEKQFRDLAQQRETAEFGMWVFLSTELLLFGGLFVSYAAFRYYYPQIFAEASHGLNAVVGTINTAILIVSSFFVALAVFAVRKNQRKKLLFSLAAALILGIWFMALKANEYYDHYRHAEFPGLRFDHSVSHALTKQIYFFLYFAMTGLHAVHLTVGIVLIAVILFRSYARAYSPSYYAPVENAGLYWHFVDIIWLFLYPLLYLIDLHH